MLIIGLTGPTGAGKGYVAQRFLRHGVPSIDTDAVYHALLVPPSACLDELVARFGTTILNPDSTLSRPALAAMVFAPGAESALGDLERITHRHVLAEVRRRCAALTEQGTPAVMVDAPRLYESGFDAECDMILAVLADRDTRRARIMERDNMDADRADARLDAQKPDSFFTDRADAVIWNDFPQNHRARNRAATAQNRGSTVGQNPQNTAETPILPVSATSDDLDMTVRHLLAEWGICHEV